MSLNGHFSFSTMSILLVESTILTIELKKICFIFKI